MKKQFRTTDIILAACLKLKNNTLVSIEIYGTKGTFVFDTTDQQTINEYNLGNLLVEPVAFNNTIKQLTTSVRRMVIKTE